MKPIEIDVPTLLPDQEEYIRRKAKEIRLARPDEVIMRLRWPKIERSKKRKN